MLTRVARIRLRRGQLKSRQRCSIAAGHAAGGVEKGSKGLSGTAEFVLVLYCSSATDSRVSRCTGRLGKAAWQARHLQMAYLCCS